MLYIPATSVAYAPYGNSVFVIEKKDDEKTKQDELTLRQQFIRTGETRGDFVAVTEGLKASEQVVSTGVFKLRNGMNVVVDNKLAPKAQLNPETGRYLIEQSRREIFYRSFHPPTSARTGRQPGDFDRRACRRSRRSTSANIRAATLPRSPCNTVYVGASAELVRGFITTPLERAIAAADGIDYLQSQSTQGLSDHHGAPEAELRLEQSALRDQLEGEPGPRRLAAGSRRFR